MGNTGKHVFEWNKPQQKSGRFLLHLCKIKDGQVAKELPWVKGPDSQGAEGWLLGTGHTLLF